MKNQNPIKRLFASGLKGLVVFMLTMAVIALQAQVATNYFFDQSVGTYTPIVGGTLIVAQTNNTTSNAGSLDDGSVYTVPIPFTFIFDGVGYTTCTVSNNGSISFGGTPILANTYGPINAATAYAGAIAAYARDLQGGFVFAGTSTLGSPILTAASSTAGVTVGSIISGTGIPAGTTVISFDATTVTMSANATSTSSNTARWVWNGEMRYETLGSPGNQIHVIQWSNMKPFGTTLTTVNGFRMNMQVRLHESDNRIEIVYGNCTPGLATSTVTAQVGLRGPNNTFATNVNNRLVTKNVHDWPTSAPGISNTSGLVFNNVATANVIPSGLTYRWTVPTCFTPTGLTATNVLTTSADLSWVAPGFGTPVGYEWEVRTSGTGGSGPAGLTDSGSTTHPTVSASTLLLSAQTAYALWVRTDCDAGGFSGWAGPYNFSTPCETFSTFPFTETFEAASPTVSCWFNEYVVGASNWTLAAGAGGGTAPLSNTAYEGVLNARFVSQSGVNSPVTKLVSPIFDLTGGTIAEVSFYYGQEVWAGDQNTLGVYYRISPSDPWVLIQDFTANVASWTNVVLNLPNISATYQIAFEGRNNFGRANVIDNVVISSFSPCAGVPDAGSVTTPVSVCSGSNAVLSATGLSVGPGISYQWQESPDGVGSWADVVDGSGDETATYTTSAINATRYFRIVTTCSAGPDSNESNVVTVNPDAPACQCTPSPICAANTTNLTDEWISGVTFAGINNPSGSTGYSDFRCVQGSAIAGSTYSFSANITNGSASTWTETVRLYIDWNQDNAFGTGEVYDIGIASVPAGSTVPISNTICVPYNATLGVTNMRVYLKFSTYAAATGCEVTTYGEVEDYWVDVQPSIPAPANDLCANAQVLTPMVANVPYGLGLPAETTVLGNLYGAVGANAPLCGGDQDVFYSLNVPFENHYIFTVNPFGGADVSLEILDACGGTSFALLNEYGAGQVESDAWFNMPAGDYILRVIGQAASPAQGQFLINVEASPTTKVMDGTGCNATGLQLEDVIRCNLVSGAQDYEWRFVEVGGGLDASYVRGSNNRNLRLSWIPGIDYNKLYNVYVRAKFNVTGPEGNYGDVWGAYRIFGPVTLLGSSDCTVETGVSVTPTQVQPAYSPNNPLTASAYTLCNNVRAVYVAQAEQYEWEFSGPPTPNCAQAQGGPGFPSDPACESAVCTADPFCCSNTWDSVCASLALNEPSCALCAAVYCDEAQPGPGFASNPACEAAVCGIDSFCCSNTWDALCAGEAALQPACASCLAPSNSAILVTTPSYFVTLGNVPGIQMNTIYQVRVRARVNGLWGAFGVQLPVSLGLPANTSIWVSHCNTVRPAAGAGSNVAAYNVCSAQSYTFRFQHVSEPERVVVRTTYTCPFNAVVPALTPGQTYTVSVKVTQGGVPGDYSTSCPITIAGPGAELVAEDVAVSKVLVTGNLGIYPNPNAGTEVRVDLNGIADGYHDVAVTIYDIYGKLMTRDVFGHQGADLSRLVRFEQELATGMYLVHVTIDGETFATEKLIVK